MFFYRSNINVTELMRRLYALDTRLPELTKKANSFIIEKELLLQESSKLLTSNSNQLLKFINDENIIIDKETIDEYADARLLITKEETFTILPNSFVNNTVIEKVEKPLPNEIYENLKHLKANQLNEKENLRQPINLQDISIFPQNILTEDQFNNIPLTIRGKTKFESVLQLFEKILVISKERILNNKISKNSNALPVLSYGELDSSGCKISGKTGDTLLACLKTLKLILIGKSGIQLTIPVIHKSSKTAGQVSKAPTRIPSRITQIRK